MGDQIGGVLEVESGATDLSEMREALLKVDKGAREEGKTVDNGEGISHATGACRQLYTYIGGLHPY